MYLPAFGVTDESHDKHVFANLDRFGTADPNRLETLEVTHFFLGPDTDHLSRVVSTAIH